MDKYNVNEMPAHDFMQVQTMIQTVGAGSQVQQKLTFASGYSRCVGMHVRSVAVADDLSTIGVLSPDNTQVVDTMPNNVFDAAKPQRLTPLQNVMPQNFTAGGKQATVTLINGSGSSVDFSVTIIYFLVR